MQSVIHTLKRLIISEKHFGLRHTRFLKAVEDNDLKSVQSLLDEGGIDVNLTDQNGIGPLYQAVSEGHLEMVRLLLAREETDVNVTDVCGTVPLHIAAQQGNQEIFNMLLQHKGIKTNAVGRYKATTLHKAFYGANQAIIDRLLTRTTVRIDAADCFGKTPLHIAITSLKSPKITQLLLMCGAIITEDLQCSLVELCLKDHNETLFMYALLVGLDAQINMRLPRHWKMIPIKLTEVIQGRMALTQKKVPDILKVYSEVCKIRLQAKRFKEIAYGSELYTMLLCSFFHGKYIPNEIVMLMVSWLQDLRGTLKVARRCQIAQKVADQYFWDFPDPVSIIDDCYREARSLNRP